jgi:hypothetical protein
MELDRFKTAWQEQPLEGAAARPLEDIMQDVHHRAVRFDRVIWRRDLLETLAGLFVIGMFGYFAWVIPSPIARVGAAIVMIGCLSIIARLYLSRNRHRASPDASAREFCAVELKRLEEQIRLLSTVGWWYLAPLLGGGAIFVLGLGGVGSGSSRDAGAAAGRGRVHLPAEPHCGAAAPAADARPPRVDAGGACRGRVSLRRHDPGHFS